MDSGRGRLLDGHRRRRRRHQRRRPPRHPGRLRRPQGRLGARRGRVRPRGRYESATEAAYTDADDTAEDLRKHGSDAEYLAALADLVAAVDGLRLLSPTTDLDGSLDYPGLVASSTTGDRIVNMVDGDEQTGTVYPQAVNMSHTFDFGPDFRVSATKFGFQSNIFADRLANSTVFGSNDGTNWTRLTPGVTEFTQDFNTLDVAEDLQDDQFRYIKVQMLEQQPDVLYGIVRGLFEMTEFHIYGERHEIGNLIKATSITSDQAVAGRIAMGDTVDVSVTAEEPLDSLTVDVMGTSAAATSDDGVNWNASVALDDVEAGPSPSRSTTPAPTARPDRPSTAPPTDRSSTSRTPHTSSTWPGWPPSPPPTSSGRATDWAPTRSATCSSTATPTHTAT